MAVLRHRRAGLAALGEPRETIDVDLTLLTGFGGEEPFVRALLGALRVRVPDAAGFAPSPAGIAAPRALGVGLDVALGGLPFEESIVARSSLFAFLPKTLLRTCSAEDLVVLKAFAARPKDWLDVEGIIIRQTGKLDWDYIQRQLQPLAELKEEPQLMAQLQRRRAECEQ